MPKLTDTAVPSYRLHKATGQAVVTLNGRDIYLGEHGSPDSKVRYARIIAEWLANGRQPVQAPADVTVREVAAAFWIHAESYYRKPDGGGTSELDRYRDILRPLKRLYGDTPASKFGPLSLKALREELVRMKWCRTVINRQIGRVKHIFKWAAGEEMIPASVHHGLQAVEGLKAGRSEARESKPVKPVAEEHARAILPHVSRQVATMIELQLITGMRPGEVCAMRTCDIDTTGKLWLYRPEHHKTEHHGHERVVYLGERCKELIQPFLKPDLKAYLFSPAEAEAGRREKQHEQRVESGSTPLSCGNTPGANRRRKPKKTPGGRYTTASYGRAIIDGCDAAFPPPTHLARIRVPASGRKFESTRWEKRAEWRDRLGKERWAELRAWQKQHRWHPNQLRHTAATRLRKEYGLEAAQVILGHRTLSVTQVYAEKNVQAAQEIMSRIG